MLSITDMLDLDTYQADPVSAALVLGPGGALGGMLSPSRSAPSSNERSA